MRRRTLRSAPFWTVVMRQGLIERSRALAKPPIVTAAVVALVAAAAYTKPGFQDQAALTSSKGGAFVIRGHVRGLYPGRQALLRLRVTNRRNFPIRVTSIRVKVAGTQGCAASNIRVTGFRGSRRIWRRGTRRLRLPISMSSTAPDACMGARFKLTYAGRAVKA